MQTNQLSIPYNSNITYFLFKSQFGSFGSSQLSPFIYWHSGRFTSRIPLPWWRCGLWVSLCLLKLYVNNEHYNGWKVESEENIFNVGASRRLESRGGAETPNVKTMSANVAGDVLVVQIMIFRLQYFTVCHLETALVRFASTSTCLCS